MGVLKSIFILIAYIITGGIYLAFVIPVSLAFLPLRKHKKVFSFFVFGYMRWATNNALPFLQTLEITELIGKEKIKKSGIIISNHQSFFDGFVVMGNFPSVPLIKSSYKFNPLFAWIAALFDFVPLEFSPAGLSRADKLLRKHLKNNELIYICPEGTRSLDGKIQKFNSLAFKLANDMQLPIFPLVIKYSKPILSKNRASFAFGKKVEITIHVLDEMRPLKSENTAKFMQRVQTAVAEEFENM